MSRLERWIVYPAIAFLGWAVFGFGRNAGVYMERTAFAGENAVKVVEAQQFRLVDADGKERASLSVPEAPHMAWGLSLRDKDGQARAWLGLTGDGSPALSLTGEGGVGRITLQVLAKGTAMVVLSDKTRWRMGMSVAADGSPNLTLLDKDGKHAARLDMDTGSPSLTLSDKDGKVLWRAPPE